MNYLISANTDIGLVKQTNQDSLSVKIINTAKGKMSFAILCDGMGGLSKGEVASATVIKAFDRWINNELLCLCAGVLDEDVIRTQWERLLEEQNLVIKSYGSSCGVMLGTTVVAMLLTETQYYLINVGDSRAYEISQGFCQLTHDHTFVAREVSLGRMTPEQAEADPRSNVLLQCIGASEVVKPDFFTGKTEVNTTYMLCSDGFRHKISPAEIYGKFNPDVLTDVESMNRNTIDLIELNKQRSERDNISVVLVRTF